MRQEHSFSLVVFAGDLYRSIRIARAPLLVCALLLALLVFPAQIPELILSYSKYKEPTRTGGKAAIALTGFACLFLSYSIELILLYLAIRPKDLLQARLRPILAFFSVIAVAPLFVMTWKIVVEIPGTVGGRLLARSDPDEAILFRDSAATYALSYGGLYLASILIVTFLYWRMLNPGKQSLHFRTLWLRKAIFFRMAPIVAVGHFIAVFYWINSYESGVIRLGSFYFLFQFCSAWLVLFSFSTLYADAYRVPIISCFLDGDPIGRRPLEGDVLAAAIAEPIAPASFDTFGGCGTPVARHPVLKSLAVSGWPVVNGPTTANGFSSIGLAHSLLQRNNATI